MVTRTAHHNASYGFCSPIKLVRSQETSDQGNLMMSAASSAHSLIVCQGTLSAAVSCQSADQAAAARGPLCLWTSACDPQLGSALSALQISTFTPYSKLIISENNTIIKFNFATKLIVLMAGRSL